MEQQIKLLSIIASLFLLCGFAGCQEEILTPELAEPKEMQLHFQGVFNNDDVKATVDQVTMYEENIITSPITSVASIVPVLFKREQQQLKVYVNRSDSGTFEVNPREYEAIIIRYNRDTGEVTFKESDGDIPYF